MSAVVQVAVATNAFVVYKGKMLLQRLNREKQRGKRSLPGGKVHEWETFDEALQREIFEETGISPELYTYKRIGVLHDVPDTTCKHMFEVLLTKDVHEFHFDPENVMECRWFAFDDLPDTAETYKSSRVLPTIKDYLKGKFTKTHQLYTHE